MLFSVLFYGFKNVSFIQKYTLMQWFPRWHSSKESACQCRRHKRCGFDPWVRKIPWRRKWQPTTVFLPGESHGWRSLAGLQIPVHEIAKSQTRLAHTCTHTHTPSGWHIPAYITLFVLQFLVLPFGLTLGKMDLYHQRIYAKHFAHFIEVAVQKHQG